MLEAESPGAGTVESDLLEVLRQLLAALENDDLERAASLAGEAHKLAHDLQG